MEGRQNYLGIYLGKIAATVVCLGSQGKNAQLIDCFSVSVDETEQQMPQALVDLIAARCAERELKFSEVTVAIDCAMFMQHNVHSEFADPKQIATTIRFDTEEVLATDVSDVAIAFRINSSDETGSDITVFTARQKILSQIILALQSNNIDPVAVEPDINCLSRFISQSRTPPQPGTFLAVLSARNGYFLNYIESQQTPAVRTFLISPAQNRGELLAREVPLTTALVSGDQPINSLEVFDSTDSVDCDKLSERLGVETVLAQSPAEAVGSQPVPEDVNTVDFAIAYGAAAFGIEKAQSVDFRRDFMPYQGRKLRLQKTLKLLSVSLVVLLLATGAFFQVRLFQKSKPVRQLRAKFNEQYSAIMFGKKPDPRSNPAKKLAGELRRVQNVKSGQLSATGEKSVSAKLTLVLKAFNACAKQTRLSITKVSITSKSVTIIGDTSSRKNTLKLFDALKKNRLQILQDNISSKGGRDIFTVTVVPKK